MTTSRRATDGSDAPEARSDARDGARNSSRRRFLGWLGAAGVGAAAGVAGVGIADRGSPSAEAASATDDVVPFYGPHQAGITTPRQTHLLFASLDLNDRSRSTLGSLFQFWTGAAVRMTRGERVTLPGDPEAVGDTGEAAGLGPSRLTVTFGVGPSLFDKLGLSRPAGLVDLPAFATDRLDPAASGGDLCIQACADDEQVAVHAVRELLRLGHPAVAVRWAQAGFLPIDPRGATPRNLMGFKDGTANIELADADALDRFVWVGSEGPAWLRGGTILVARRIHVRIARWDASELSEQERVIGRRKSSGAPLSGGTEFDPLDLRATGSNGKPMIGRRAHVRLAAPDSNDGVRILRRPYSFVDGIGGEGNLSAGLFFLAYQRDPRTGFIPVQRRLASSDALNEYLRHTGSAVFAMFRGVRPGRAIGDGLL